MDTKWYYQYDQDTKQYICAILSPEKPENTTETMPVGFVGTPIFDEQTNTWNGTKSVDWSNEQATSTDDDDETITLQQFKNYQEISTKTMSSLMLQVAAQAVKITALSELKNSGGSN